MFAKHQVEIGIYLPPVKMSWEQLRERTLLAEQLGFDSMWFYDHFYSPGAPDTPSFEAWTLVSALAAVTTKIRFGHMVLCNSFRHPAVLARMALSLDAISNGRIEIGIGTGSYQREFEEYGLPYGSFRERAEQLEEGRPSAEAVVHANALELRRQALQLKRSAEPATAGAAAASANHDRRRR